MMKNCIKLLFISLLFVSCKQKIDPNQLTNLNGYWEIAKAIDSNGTKIDYKINETIDYISLKNNQGFRKKVMPQFDGKYLVNNQQETIKIIENKPETYIEYSTEFSKWKEEIISISKDELILKNDQKTTYYYKKHLPFSIK
jgi:hypothetical protein